jgi:cysteine-rich repeat protein
MNQRYLVGLLGGVGLFVLTACGDNNNPETPRLAANCTAAAGTITVTSAPAFPASGGVVQVDAEWIGYGSKAGDTLSGLIRGMEGTTPAVHNAGALVTLVGSQAPNTRTMTLIPQPLATATLGQPTSTATQSIFPTVTSASEFSPTSTSAAPSLPTRTPESSTATPTTSGGAVCGDGVLQEGEQCDDGNLQGGDGCAANCAKEMSLDCTLGCIDTNDNGICGEEQDDLDDIEAIAVTNGQYATITLHLTGKMSFIAGRPRNTEVKTVDPTLTFPPSQLPMVIRPADLRMNPIPLVGISCNCGAVLATGQFGPGLAGKGVFGCNESGLSEVDYVWTADHDISDRDPTCATGSSEDGTPAHPHPGACNDAGRAAYYNGGPRNSMTMNMHLRINLAPDNGKCVKDCSVPDFGPDCEPCTLDDEPTLVIIDSPVVLSTGTSMGEVLHANYWPPPVKIEGGVNTGIAPDCDSLMATLSADPKAPAWDMQGSATSLGIGIIDTPQLGDCTSSVTMACVPPGD